MPGWTAFHDGDSESPPDEDVFHQSADYDDAADDEGRLDYDGHDADEEGLLDYDGHDDEGLHGLDADETRGQYYY